MNEKEFLRLADECLKDVSDLLEDCDPDELDYDLGDGVLSIEFADGAKFILSRQAATSQIWLAADAHGFHYSYDTATEAWLDDRDGHELLVRLGELLSERLGREVEL